MEFSQPRLSTFDKPNVVGISEGALGEIPSGAFHNVFDLPFSRSQTSRSQTRATRVSWTTSERANLVFADVIYLATIRDHVERELQRQIEGATDQHAFEHQLAMYLDVSGRPRNTQRIEYDNQVHFESDFLETTKNTLRDAARTRLRIFWELPVTQELRLLATEATDFLRRANINPEGPSCATTLLDYAFGLQNIMQRYYMTLSNELHSSMLTLKKDELAFGDLDKIAKNLLEKITVSQQQSLLNSSEIFTQIIVPTGKSVDILELTFVNGKRKTLTLLRHLHALSCYSKPIHEFDRLQKQISHPLMPAHVIADSAVRIFGDTCVTDRVLPTPKGHVAHHDLALPYAYRMHVNSDPQTSLGLDVSDLPESQFVQLFTLCLQAIREIPIFEKPMR